MRGRSKTIILGNVGRDPEIRTTQKGGKVASLSVATNEQWKDKAGEKQEHTEWHRVVVYNEPTVNFIERYVTKGSAVYVEGQNKTRKWTGDDGNERYTTEVVVSFGGCLELVGGNYERAPATQNRESLDPHPDDEIPF